MDAAAVTPAEKIAFLRSAGAQPDDPAGIELVETHFAWIFLGERFVYKLKKPIRFERIDFVALESRRASCELELSLNRRLAELTYLAIVPLTLSHGELRLGRSGTVVDWHALHVAPGRRSRRSRGVLARPSHAVSPDGRGARRPRERLVAGPSARKADGLSAEARGVSFSAGYRPPSAAASNGAQ